MLPGRTTKSEDDITHALANILKANKAISGDVVALLLSHVEIPRQGTARDGQRSGAAADLL